MIEKEPKTLKGKPEKLEFESEPDINLQLEYVLDSLSELKEKDLIDEETVRHFLTTRDMISAMENKKLQKIEKSALLKQYRSLIRNKQPQ